MRGETERQATLLLGLTPDGFVPREHPLRRIKPLVDSAFGRMSPVFDAVYAAGGRPSIPPEHLLNASLLMAFYTIRSERRFCEQLRYNILFKWFLDLNVEGRAVSPDDVQQESRAAAGSGRGAGAAQGSGARGAPAAVATVMRTSEASAAVVTRTSRRRIRRRGSTARASSRARSSATSVTC